MANTKKITAHYTTAKTLHATVKREADGYLLDSTDGAFKASPSDPFSVLTEDGTALGEYTFSESRITWNDGRYTVAVREQAGAGPAWADTVVSDGEMVIRDDSEVYLDSLPSFIHKWILNRLVEEPNNTWTLYDDDNATPLKTWTWDPSARTRSKAQ